MVVAWVWTRHCAMRGLLILALLCQGLFATNPSDCRNYTAQAAADEAEYLINKLHHHGYKFKLDSFTEEEVRIINNSEQISFFKQTRYLHLKCLYTFKYVTYDPLQSTSGQPSCLNKLTLTLSETKCHIVNPKPFEECEIRAEAETVSLRYLLLQCISFK